MRILAIRLGALGDVLNVFPAIAGLKQAMPEAQVSWLVEEVAAPLVQANADVAEVLILPRKRWQSDLLRPWRFFALPGEVLRFAREVGRKGFDAALDFQGTFKSGLIGRLSGVARRIGFAPPHCRELNHLLTSETVALPVAPLPRAEKNLALVRALVPHASNARSRLACAPEDVALAEQLTRGWRGDGRALVGMHPGTSRFGRFKRWPAERYAEVARKLAQEVRARMVVTWGPDERELAQEVTERSGGAASLAPPMSLRQLAELLRRLDLFIASDTGPLHLAAVLGRPVVAVLGPKDPVIYGPYGCPSIIVRKALACSPCTRRRCPRARCLMEISAEEVVAAAHELLRRGAQ